MDRLPDFTAADSRLRAALAKGARRLHLQQPIHAGQMYGLATTKIRALAGDPNPIDDTNRYDFAQSVGSLRAAILHGVVDQDAAIKLLDSITQTVLEAIAEAEKTRP